MIPITIEWRLKSYTSAVITESQVSDALITIVHADDISPIIFLQGNIVGIIPKAECIV